MPDSGGDPRRSGIWNLVLLPMVLFVAGSLFAASAHTSSGTDLRGGRYSELRQLVTARTADVRTAERREAALRAQVDTANQNREQGEATLRRPRADAEALETPAGLVAVTGPGITVRMDDAPESESGTLPPGTVVNDFVVHQQDVQAVVNALWAGGAEAMTIMGQRVVSTTAVRCVGNTLWLHDKRYSPPFEIQAIGDTGRLQQSLDGSSGVRAFQESVLKYQLRYSATPDPSHLTFPPYQGPLAMNHATSPNR